LEGKDLDFSFVLLGLGIAAAGYFIGDGLKNFKNPQAKGLIEALDDDDEHELIKDNEVYYFIGISKEDAKTLFQEHPDIPHIMLNGTVYYPKKKLREWLLRLGD
jgi:hypothetical protein